MTKPPKYFLEIAQQIAKLYPAAKKIVEIGIGSSPWALLTLKKLLPNTRLIAVDIDDRSVIRLRRAGLEAEVDDVNNPRFEIYRGVDLIYSIRPPMELISPMKNIAENVGADLIIFPLSEDSYLYQFKPPWKRLSHPRLQGFIRKVRLKNGHVACRPEDG